MRPIIALLALAAVLAGVVVCELQSLGQARHWAAVDLGRGGCDALKGLPIELPEDEDVTVTVRVWTPASTRLYCYRLKSADPGIVGYVDLGDLGSPEELLPPPAADNAPTAPPRQAEAR